MNNMIFKAATFATRFNNGFGQCDIGKDKSPMH